MLQEAAAIKDHRIVIKLIEDISDLLATTPMSAKFFHPRNILVSKTSTGGIKMRWLDIHFGLNSVKTCPPTLSHYYFLSKKELKGHESHPKPEAGLARLVHFCAEGVFACQKVKIIEMLYEKDRETSESFSKENSSKGLIYTMMQKPRAVPRAIFWQADWKKVKP